MRQKQISFAVTARAGAANGCWAIAAFGLALPRFPTAVAAQQQAADRDLYCRQRRRDRILRRIAAACRSRPASIPQKKPLST